MPVSGGGSSLSATNTQLFVGELLKSQANLARLEPKKLGLAEEAARFYERHVKLLERSNAEKAKETEVLEKKNEVLWKRNMKMC
jgi:hypothetical protein